MLFAPLDSRQARAFFFGSEVDVAFRADVPSSLSKLSDSDIPMV
jgi:hypothetical protein